MNPIENLKDLIIYQSQNNENISVEVLYDEEDFWLTQKSMAKLFNVEVNTINYHLKEVFKSGELIEESVIRKIRITANDGKNYNTNFYSLDAIIAVGYRVNAKEATSFRIWATNTLKEYIKKGFVLLQMKENLYKAFSEVDTILEYSSEEIANKIPKKFKDIIKNNKDLEYKLEIDDNKALTEQELLPETKEILALIYREYLCSEEEKEKLIEENQKKLDEMNEQYNIERVFKKREKVQGEKKRDPNEFVLVVIKPAKWYTKIWRKFKKIFS